MLEQDIPIDIHTSKLYDWLLSRRHCTADWQKKALIIREKINNAIQDMPSHPEITKLLSGTYINKFHCHRIVDLLKETEADTKNMFGRYGSQRMKDWLEVLTLYEKDGVYLAEAANLLIRNVKYEVPNIKKQIAKSNHLKEECDKKELEYTKHEAVVKNELNALMKELGIKSASSNKMRKELITRLSRLPEIYDKVAEEIKSMKSAINYYCLLTNFTNSNVDESTVIPLIRFIAENGNTTTYEYLYGERPTEIIQPKLFIDQGKDDDDNDDGIDWGSDEINYNEEIDYGIVLEESGIEVECNTVGSTAEDTKSGVAEGKFALTLLDNPETRTEFINQLYEVESFVKMRLLEMQNERSGVLMVNNQLHETTENVASMMDSIVLVRQLLLDTATTHLHNIKHSPRYVEQLVNKVEHKHTLMEKTVASKKAVHERGLQAIEDVRQLTPRLQLIIEKTKELQTDIEKDISKKYKNRPVNLMGGVATL